MQRDIYLGAWSPKSGAGVQDKAKLRDKERLVVSNETDSFYRGTHKSVLLFSSR